MMPEIVGGARLRPLTLSVDQTLEPLSTAQMLLPPEDTIGKADWVKIQTPDGGAGWYRVSSIVTDTESGRQDVSLDHGACTLGDMVLKDSYKKKDTVANHLAYILGKQLDARWTARTAPAMKLYADLTGETLLSAILKLMDAIPSYYASFTQEDETHWYVDIAERPQTASCEARLSRNLSSCEVEYDTQEIVTRVYDKGLSGGYLDSPNVNVYGVRAEQLNLNESYTAAEALAVAQSYLDAHGDAAVSVTISGRELSQITGLSIDEFAIGSVCRVVIPWLNLTLNEAVTEKQYPDILGDPEGVTVTLANARPDLSLMVAQAKGGAGGAMRLAEENERQLVIHQTAIERNDERILLWATAEEWDEIAEQYQIMDKSQFALSAEQIQSTVLQTGITAGVATFDPTHTYAAGDKCIYNGVLYRFTSAHTGAWTGTDVATVSSQQSQIAQNAHDITLKVSEGDVATQLEIECGNVTISGGDLLVDGYLEANGITTSAGGTLTADTLEARFGEIDTVSALTVSAGSVSGADSYTMDSYSGDLVDSVKLVQIVPVSGTDSYKLQYKTFKGDAWTDAGTFNRAAASPTLSGSWASGVLTVTSDPAAVENLYYYLSGSVSWSGNTGTIPIKYSTTPTGAKQDTGYTVTVSRGGSITAAAPQSSAPSGTLLRTVTVGTSGSSTYVKVNATGRRQSDDYIQIKY